MSESRGYCLVSLPHRPRTPLSLRPHSSLFARRSTAGAAPSFPHTHCRPYHPRISMPPTPAPSRSRGAHHQRSTTPTAAMQRCVVNAPPQLPLPAEHACLPLAASTNASTSGRRPNPWAPSREFRPSRQALSPGERLHIRPNHQLLRHLLEAACAEEGPGGGGQSASGERRER